MPGDSYHRSYVHRSLSLALGMEQSTPGSDEGGREMASANGNEKPAGAVGENKPRLIFWEVTKGRNLRCIHCRATATELSSPTDLPTRTALEIIDQIAAAANPILVLSGGEPLYRNDIFQLARHAPTRACASPSRRTAHWSRKMWPA